MLMNRAETLLMNSPPRRWVQQWYETPALLRMGGPLGARARALEIGCGSGHGARMIIERFGAARVDAIDLDPVMVARARRRLAPYGNRVRVGRGDVTDLSGARVLHGDGGTGGGDAAYDAVFDFGIVHHVPTWRAAIAEVARVLRPGGTFYFEEVTKHALDRPTYRLLTDHPKHDRFTPADFTGELERQGLTVLSSRIVFFGDFVLGVARRDT